MKGDFSRNSFRKKKHYSKVNMQQGRVQLDADWNEQSGIILHHRSSALKDVIGICGVPLCYDKFGFEGFKILPGHGNDYGIKAGHYYVDGILCENELDVFASNQPDLPNGYGALPKKEGIYLVYLDVWERHIDSLDDPEIREVALGGPDTATRSKIVWQVKIEQIDLPSNHKWDQRKLCPSYSTPEPGKLIARSRKIVLSGKGDNVSPEVGYQGLESQLYRVEIHEGGTVGTKNPPTFKWSRDNGSVVAKVNRFSDESIIVSNRKDQEFGFSAGNWIEVIDDSHELRSESGTFVKVKDVKIGESDETELKFNPSNVYGDNLTEESFPVSNNIVKVRRWDMQDKPIKIKIPFENEGYIELEYGVEVRFERASYRTGDYWLIPARPAISDIIWPDGSNGPEPLSPEGIEHHFCSLALLDYDGVLVEVISDCRKAFPAITNLPLIYYVGGDGQEASPGNELAFPLRVGVTVDPSRSLGLKVRFIIEDGGGKVLGVGCEEKSDYLDVDIENQVVECCWKLGKKGSQQVKAVLVNENSTQIGLPLYFNASIELLKNNLGTVRPKLAELGELIDPKARMEDLVLPKRKKQVLREMAFQIKHRRKVYKDWGFENSRTRGLGISSLFVGPGGTGKTMAAEIVAHESELDLFRIDLSEVVSEYIGETEKNLGKIFDAAEDGGAILFFDEADAMFGRRSEVENSHDRYGNLVTNFLLEKMEKHKGITILASNLEISDDAFLRRMHFVVNFPFPNEESRLEIWKRVFPEKAPLGDVDFDSLSKLKLTGGEIMNIALNAALLAAKNSDKITMEHINQVTRRRKSKRFRRV